MKYRFIIASVLAFALAFSAYCADGDVKVGEPLPTWREGELDVHFINTGRGECTWMVFPDGTTFLTDASGTLIRPGEDRIIPTPAKPSDKLTAGRVIVDYISHFAPAVSEGHINYFLLTHHHGDHMGNVRPETPLHDSGLFRLGSLPEIGSSLVMDRIMDRDWPDFSYPVPEEQDTPVMHNYRAFLDWTISTNGTQVEQWSVGSCTQVVPVHDPDCGVSVRSLSGNGRFWTGEGEESYTTMPSTEEFETGSLDAIPTENCYSCSYILSFGDFDIFLGGDLQHNGRENYTYKDVETPVAKVARKVEVMKADHHGTMHTQDAGLLSVLNPDVWVCSNWTVRQPRPAIVDAVWAVNPDCDIYCTNMAEQNRPVLGRKRLERMASTSGHVVVRVAPDGRSYMVYVLADTDQLYTVVSVHGPYLCTE